MEAVYQTRDVLSWCADLVFSKVHPLIDDRGFLRIGAQQVNLGPDATHWNESVQVNRSG